MSPANGAEGPGIRLHLGAHKTGSTYLATLFRGNAALLEARGARFFGTHELGPLLEALRAGAGRGGRRRPSATAVGDAFPALPGAFECDRLILSCEGFIGHLGPRGGKTLLYPRAAPRLNALRAGLAPRLVGSVHLCIREQAGYLAAAYVELIRHRPFIAFEAYLGGTDPATLSWTPLILTLRGIFPEASIHVWDHAAVRADAALAVDDLFGGAIFADMTPPDRTAINQTSSAEAIARFAGIPDAGEPAARRAALGRLEEAHPVSEENPKYNPWSGPERARLEARYRRDLDEIAGLEGVTLLR